MLKKYRRMYQGNEECCVHLPCETNTGAWNSTSAEDTNKLEKVQTQAARFIHGNFSERNPGCVTQTVNNLVWETLENRRKKDRLTTLFDLAWLSRYGLWWHIATQRQTDAPKINRDQRLYQPTATVKIYKNSFFLKIIRDWNRLQAQVTDSQTIKEFRAAVNSQSQKWHQGPYL